MLFPYPINFVAPDVDVWPELRNWNGTRIDPTVLSKRSGGIIHSWILRTYYQLRLAGYDVELSPQPRAGAINFVSPRDFGRRQKRLDTFVVIPQGDAHHAMLADFRILQNGLHPIDANTAAIWHWPQPGIIPRDPGRQDRLSNLSYKGRVLNLDAKFRSQAFIDALHAEGVAFDIDAYTGLRGEHSWNDYQVADAVLAVRNLTVYDARKKPASKLVNAWFADTPAILGPEPPFQELRTSDYDYLEVRSPHEAIMAIRSLQQNPDLYRAMIENGRKRRAEFTEEALTSLWGETISGPITEAFERWSEMSKLPRYIQTATGILRENASKKKDAQRVQEGPRLLETRADRKDSL